MVRTRKLKATPIMRGVLALHPADVQVVIDRARGVETSNANA